jgi:hypothetical protein
LFKKITEYKEKAPEELTEKQKKYLIKFTSNLTSVEEDLLHYIYKEKRELPQHEIKIKLNDPK